MFPACLRARQQPIRSLRSGTSHSSASPGSGASRRNYSAALQWRSGAAPSRTARPRLPAWVVASCRVLAIDDRCNHRGRRHIVRERAVLDLAFAALAAHLLHRFEIERPALHVGFREMAFGDEWAALALAAVAVAFE